MAPVPVLLMIHTLNHGGSERQLANTAIAMDRSRFTPHVACVNEGFRATDLIRAEIPVYKIHLKSFFHPGVVPAARGLRRYIRQHGIRLVHTFDHTLNILGVPAAKGLAVALSSQRSYVDLVPPKHRYPGLLAHRLADGVVVNCEALRRNLADEYHFPEKRIQVCYNGLDTAQFHAEGRIARRDPVIGVACVFRWEKNLTQLLEGFARVRHLRPGVRLLMVGSGPERDKLVALAESLGIAADCEFRPSTGDVAPVLREIDIFVHPSLTEGLPNGVMEAMACGCTVVASRVGGCPELIEEGVSGLLFERNDLDSLTRQLSRALLDDEARIRMSEAARQRMKNFSIEKAARRMEEIYSGYLD